MNLLAIIGSPRKGKATDTLVDKAIEGIKAKEPDCNVKKINLVDYNIQYCKNCLVCRDADTNEPLSKCVIKDDMAQIYEELLESDALILGTPVHSGYPTALMMIFLERITWTFKKRKSIIIVTSGIISPLYRRFCDWATKCIRDNVRDSLNAKTVGDMYAGDIEHRGVDYYFDKANKLGQKLV
jgi:NAD(P)H-dependent FMN reductase